jgi:hypothetical protein
MTVHSFTSDKTYETTPEHCTCFDFYFRQSKSGGKCKHQKALIRQINRAQMFLLLFARFDCRANGDEDTQRCYYELAMAS